MSDYIVSKVYIRDKRSNQQIDSLLEAEGIRRDNNLDYTCAIYDDEQNVIATGSCFGNTLRCLAVSKEYQGEGLLNKIVSHLMEVQFDRGNYHLFLYTKCNSSKFFSDLGFYEITRVEGQLVFMESRKKGFADYISALSKSKRELPKVSALVMNANPFSLGHLYLAEKAAGESDLLHLFIVSEDASLVPFSVRKELVKKGTAHIRNICYHDSGPYMISNATFPSYFQKDSESVVKGHALLDLTIFKDIANGLSINVRYIGEEPNSQVTNIYNQIMKSKLPEFGIECIEVPRIKSSDEVISASNIRKSIKENDLDKLRRLVPDTTYKYFLSNEAKAVVEKIKSSENIIHH